MRILFATRAWESPEIEGGYLLLKDLARELAQGGNAGVECFFFSVQGGEDSGVSLLPVFRKTGWGPRRGIEFFLGLAKFLRRVDVVHFAHTPTLVNSLAIRFLKWRNPAVRFVQTITGFSARESRLMYWGDGITTISEKVAAQLRIQHGISAEQISPAARPQRLAQAAPLPEGLLDTLEDAPLVVFPVDVFRLNLVEFDIGAICRRLLDRHPALRLVFLDRFGQEGAIRGAMPEIAADQVLFLPVIDYMGSLLLRADVVVLPMSNVDGKFNPPMVLFEALQSRCNIVCSGNIDLPEQPGVARVHEWNQDGWVAAIATALSESNERLSPRVTPDFGRNTQRYLDLYLEQVPVFPPLLTDVSFAAFLERLDMSAKAGGAVVWYREGGLDKVDFSGARDVDIWLKGGDRALVAGVLRDVSATRIIQRRSATWTSHDVYVVRLADGFVQLDVGIDRISTGYVTYAGLDTFAAPPGLQPLPADVELFAREVKAQRRGTARPPSVRELATLAAQLDTDGVERLGTFLRYDAADLRSQLPAEDRGDKVRKLISAAIRRSAFDAAKRPLEFLRVSLSKSALPVWPMPFGRRARGGIIAIIGTDGAGKSTTQDSVASSLQAAGYRPGSLYMGRARGNMLVNERLKQKAEGAFRKSPSRWMKYLASWVYVFDYTARFAKIFHRSRLRGETVLCDRYFYDIRLMESYTTLGYRLLSLIAPRPDILVLLDCSTDTLMGRKAERSPAEYKKQRSFYATVVAEAKTRHWRGAFNTDEYDVAQIAGAISRLNDRASHKRYDY